MRQRFGIGVIGCGTIAQSAHLPAIARLGERVRLVAVADVRGEAAEHAARTWGAEEAYADYRAMLARPDIDVVVIATPEFLHAEQVAEAAAAGKHILCEKPMAPSVEEADAMIAAARAAGIKFMVGHSRRFTPRYQAVRAAIDRGAIGQVRIARENERRPRAMYRGLSLATGAWSPDGERTWMTDPKYSLGAAMLNAIHEVDLLRWFVGDEVTSVYAESRIGDEKGEVPDFISIQLALHQWRARRHGSRHQPAARLPALSSVGSLRHRGRHPGDGPGDAHLQRDDGGGDARAAELRRAPAYRHRL